MPKSLNELVFMYLKENGISNIFFSKYIGASSPMVSYWLNGKGNIGKDKLYKIHEFLEGKHLKTLDEIIGEEKGK